jgi:hypothetical protein
MPRMKDLMGELGVNEPNSIDEMLEGVLYKPTTLNIKVSGYQRERIQGYVAAHQILTVEYNITYKIPILFSGWSSETITRTKNRSGFYFKKEAAPVEPLSSLEQQTEPFVLYGLKKFSFTIKDTGLASYYTVELYNCYQDYSDPITIPDIVFKLKFSTGVWSVK